MATEFRTTLDGELTTIRLYSPDEYEADGRVRNVSDMTDEQGR